MSGYVVQVTLVFILTFSNSHAKKPPGYVAPPKEYDPNPPKYEYGYRIQEDKVTQGKDEQRDGIYAQGRYYVENGTESSQNVKYFADDWGYHPVVEYSNKGPHSKSSTRFVLGEEAIKLKNNQKSIPQDPSDPGKADNLAKLDPSGQPPQVQDVTLINQPQLLQVNPSTVLQPNFAEQKSPTQLVFDESNTENQPTSNSLPQTNDINNSNNVQPVIVNLQPAIIEPGSQQAINQPQLILQSDPQLQVLTNQPQNRELILDSNLQPQSVLGNPNSGSQQPVFYYIQPQTSPYNLDALQSNIENSLKGLPQFQVQQPDETSNQHFQLLHQDKQIQLHTILQTPEDQHLPQLEPLPQPQALIIENKEQYDNSNRLSSIGEEINEFINNNEIKGNGGQVLETAALIKPPNQIVEFENNAPQHNYKEFGARLNPKDREVNHNKLIESTKNLVSGTDVLNINAAQEHSINDEIETSTLQNLLQRYVTPTIIHNYHNIDLNQLDIVSSTTFAPPVTDAQTSLLKEPIIVAESENDSDSKPVTEKNEENKDNFPSTARSTLTKTTLNSNEENTESSSDHVLVTPRPVSSKFLAPITAGVQLQHVDEQIFGDSKTVETQEEKQERVSIQIQNTIPYYLGMYQYPLGYDVQVNGQNTSMEQKAISDIELGKTLLYFPGEEPPRAEPLIGEPSKGEQSQQLVNIDSNQLTRQQLVVESNKELFIEGQPVLQNQYQVQHNQAQQNIGTTNEQVQQLYHQTDQVPEYIQETPAYSEFGLKNAESEINSKLVTNEKVERPIHNTEVIEKKIPYPQPYPVERIVERPVHVPIEVTKYVDRPYPVKIPVPYPQPYPVEKVVKEPYPVEVKVPVHVPVPVEKTVERKIPVPYYIEKPVDKIIEKPVEKIVERKIPVPYYIEKPVEKIVEKHVPHYIDRPFPIQEPVSSQAFLLQIPGLFSQQKYSTLVRNSLQNQNIPYFHSISYAPQNNQYLPSQQIIPLNKGHAQRKLKKLNLLVLPRINIANLPPINNPLDLYQNTASHQNYRYSNAQLNNGYLPPATQSNNGDHNNQIEAAASNADEHTIRKHEEHLGLIPPKHPLFEDSRKQRTARAHFDEKSIRMEYGFMPPLIPSLEIDEQGQPIEKDDNKN